MTKQNDQVAVDKVSGLEVKVLDLKKCGFKPFKCANGIAYYAKEKSCLFCKNCSDIFYDYSNGPYMFICREDRETTEGMAGTCKWFKGEDE